MLLKKIGCILCLLGFFAYAAADNNDSDDVSQVPVNGQSQDAIGNVLLQSISLIGIPYRWGGNTPQEGMDCSGFIRYIFKKSLGITLPRTAAQMSKIGKNVSLDELEPGDLIFFNVHHDRVDHVGMYIGDNKFIQSPHTGDSIKVTELTSAWRAHITRAKRIVQEDVDENGSTTVESYQEIRDETLPVRSGYSRHRRTHSGSHGSTKHSRSTKHSSSHHTTTSHKKKHR